MEKAAIADFHRRLHQWYASNGRSELPWRNTGDSYAIYVSEIMLQQTQVKTVLERYYVPFLARFPTIQSLAQAPQKEVLQAWQGLGYYNRALNLHKTAQSSPQGLPASVDALIALPGIGRNTAHAVAAFAFRQPLAVMEANVKRVLSRIFALTAPQDKELWDYASQLLDTRNPFDYNQAMMDVGAMVCTKNNPSCDICPANQICKGQTSPELFPGAKPSKQVKIRRKKIIVLRNKNNYYYAVPRSGRFLSGLFHFIEINEDENGFLLSGKKYSLNNAKRIGDIRQQYSHFTLEAEVWLMEGFSTRGNAWYPANEFLALPMSMAEQNILKLITVKPV